MKNMVDTTNTTYVLDTSVLIDNPNVINNELVGDNIIIPLSVIRELDVLKTSISSSQARQARQALRNIKFILSEKEDNSFNAEETIYLTSIKNKAQRKDGGYLNIEFNHSAIQEDDVLYDKFSLETNDDRIIAVAYNYSKEIDNVILLTKDTGMAVIATSLGVLAHIYTSSSDNFDPGEGIKNYDAVSDEKNKLYSGEKVLIKPFEATESYPANTGIVVNDGTRSSAIGISDGKYIHPVKWDTFFAGSHARGVEQNIAASLMLGYTKHDRENGRNGEFFGSISGRAGSGKTYLTLGCAIESLKQGVHDNIKVFRPTVAPSKNSNLGFLPGDLETKLEPWYYAINDALVNLGAEEITVKGKSGGLVNVTEKISIEPINFVRGRGFHNSFIIIDEAQNLETHEIITLLTRVGSGSCVVMTWDPSQIDNPLISSGRAEGPLEAIKRTIKSDMTWHVELKRSERGGVSSLF